LTLLQKSKAADRVDARHKAGARRAFDSTHPLTPMRDAMD